MTSTNAFAQELISKTNPTDGTVIITDEQTHGKGQGQNVWQSAPGENLTCSLIFNTDFLMAADQYYLNMAVAVAVINALKGFISANDLSIKWPNDIMIGDKKVGGLLIENSIQGRYLRNSIIGIGINVNQTSFPGLPHAISIRSQTGCSFDIAKVLNAICNEMEQAILSLRRGEMKDWMNAYNERLYQRTRPIEFQMKGEQRSGILIGVDHFGRLMVDIEGEQHAFQHGEIEWNYLD